MSGSMPSARPRVLFVDDDPSVLAGLQRSLHEHADEWDMLFAGSGAQALAMMAESPVDVVIADMRMPVMDGATLLDQVRRLNPKAARIILSGFTDSLALNRSIGPAHQYFQKPCSTQVLAEAIRRTIAVRAILSTDTLLELVAGTRMLDSSPRAVAALIRELQSPRGSAAEAARIVASDVGMTAQVLKLVNSGFFGMSRPVGDLLQAVRLLGFDTLGAVVVLANLFEGFRTRDLPAGALDRLARFSLEVGELARRIAVAENLPALQIEQARCAGMLAHVGTLILLTRRPHEVERIHEMLDSGVGTVVSCERDAFGATHAEVGASLLSLWGFSDPVVEAVLYHHAPSACTCPSKPRMSPITAVHAAQHLAKPVPTGADVEEWQMRGLDAAYLRDLGLDGHVARWAALADDLDRFRP
ncbi:MAG: HDOD domain-containing protein [Actinomycetota bacterium]